MDLSSGVNYGNLDSLLVNECGEKLDLSFHGGTRNEVLVILGHGLTGNKDRPLIRALAEGLSACGWPCLRFSYSGNGESDGEFSESTISKEVSDLRTIIDSVPPSKKIVYIGHSMGGAVGVIAAATSIRISALVSLAGMVQTGNFVQREFGDLTPGKDMMWEEKDHPLSKRFVEDLKQIDHTLRCAEELVQPWLLIHGEDDDVVPLSDSQQAFDAARGNKKIEVMAGAGHVFEETGFDPLIEMIDAWISEVL